jgi:hypothetical protein
MPFSIPFITAKLGVEFLHGRIIEEVGFSEWLTGAGSKVAFSSREHIRFAILRLSAG